MEQSYLKQIYHRRLSWNGDWFQDPSMVDATVCQINNFIKEDTNVEGKIATIRHLTNLYSFIKCDMFLCNVQ